MLPSELTAEVVEQEIFTKDLASQLEAVDETMSCLFDELIAKMVTRFGLSEAQEEELLERLSWRLEITPASSPPQGREGGNDAVQVQGHL